MTPQIPIANGGFFANRGIPGYFARPPFMTPIPNPFMIQQPFIPRPWLPRAWLPMPMVGQKTIVHAPPPPAPLTTTEITETVRRVRRRPRDSTRETVIEEQIPEEVENRTAIRH